MGSRWELEVPMSFPPPPPLHCPASWYRLASHMAQKQVTRTRFKDQILQIPAAQTERRHGFTKPGPRLAPDPEMFRKSAQGGSSSCLSAQGGAGKISTAVSSRAADSSSRQGGGGINGNQRKSPSCFVFLLEIICILFLAIFRATLDEKGDEWHRG